MWGVGNSSGTCLYLDILYSMDRYKFDNIFASQINIKVETSDEYLLLGVLLSLWNS